MLPSFRDTSTSKPVILAPPSFLISGQVRSICVVDAASAASHVGPGALGLTIFTGTIAPWVKPRAAWLGAPHHTTLSIICFVVSAKSNTCCPTCSSQLSSALSQLLSGVPTVQISKPMSEQSALFGVVPK